MIPLKYNVRNLRVRWVNTVLSILATGLVVWSSCILFGFVEGLQYSLNVSGDPLDMIVLRKGSTNETNGGYDESKADSILTLDGIARDPQGRPLASIELLNIPVVERRGGGRANIIVRGIDPVARELRPSFQIIAGRDFEPGKAECIVSKNLSKRFAGAGLGELLVCGDKEQYRVVGIFTAGGSAAESEVWVDRQDLEQRTGREGSVSSVQLRAASAADYDRIKSTIENDNRFKLAPLSEVDYFAAQSRSSLFLKVGGTIIAILLTAGAMFAAANTMYAAVRTRTREIGTMRALGFSRMDVLFCFLGESMLLCLLGGALGLLATLPLQVITYGTSNFDTFSEVTFNFRFGPLVMGVAVGMTLAMGLVGGLFPALRAVRMDVIKALREV
ncbi:MAG: ABC transporter permease [Isosphaeraceae bacterium]|nr:ABC transporter permease [Isosphaeraceae bacterium]